MNFPSAQLHQWKPIPHEYRILIVDDEPEIRKSLRGVLEDEGYKVSATAHGEACLDELKKQPL